MSGEFSLNYKPRVNPQTDVFMRAHEDALKFTANMYLDTLCKMNAANHYAYWGTPSHTNITPDITISADRFTPVGMDNMERVQSLTFLSLDKYLRMLHIIWTNIIADCGGLSSYTSDEFDASYHNMLLKAYYNLFSYVDLFLHCPTAVYNLTEVGSFWIIDETIDSIIEDNISFSPMYAGETLKDRFNLYASTFIDILAITLCVQYMRKSDIAKYYDKSGFSAMKKLAKAMENKFNK